MPILSLDLLKTLAEKRGYRFIEEPDGTIKMIRPDGTLAMVAHPPKGK